MNKNKRNYYISELMDICDKIEKYNPNCTPTLRLCNDVSGYIMLNNEDLGDFSYWYDVYEESVIDIAPGRLDELIKDLNEYLDSV